MTERDIRCQRDSSDLSKLAHQVDELEKKIDTLTQALEVALSDAVLRTLRIQPDE